MSALPEVLTRLGSRQLLVGWCFVLQGFGGCARAHPPGVAPEALEEWIYSSRGFSQVERRVLSRLSSPRVRVRVAGSRLGCRKSPRASTRSKRMIKSFPVFFCVALTHPFRSEGGVEYARLPSVGASSDTSGELLPGKSEWRPVPHSIGVG